MARTGYLWSPRFLGHDTGRIHAERPERVLGLDPERMGIDVPGIEILDIDTALGLPGVYRVHDPDFVDGVRTAHVRRLRALDAGDTRVHADSYAVAVDATAAALTLTRAVLAGVVDNGFAALRPPGHHAHRGHTRGFCYFNHVAAAAAFAVRTGRARRVLVVDWDVHPGDGTMALFYDDPDVHVLSLHQRGLFPEEVGRLDQRGRGPGEGASRNVPLPEGGRGVDWLRALETAVGEAAEACRPELVLISCGFDAHAGDPLADTRLLDDDFRALFRMVHAATWSTARGRIVSLLEGGYCPPLVRRLVRHQVEELTVAARSTAA